ncbi:MAG: 50S ribosomal protein L17 [Calditrichaeota bacterium]|nr:50S ribosomal protein L17 [Calditrichota bacterium]
MRHLNRKAHLNRTAAHRKALFGNLSAALFTHKRIVTTLGKARYARRFAERMITFARRGDVAARRHVMRYVQDKLAVKTLFDDLGPHFKNRDGGYTRIIKLGTRRGDAAPMALIELVGFDDISTTDTKVETKSRLKASQKKAVEEKVSPEAAVKEEDVAKEEVVATESEPDVVETTPEETVEEPKPEDSKEESSEK